MLRSLFISVLLTSLSFTISAQFTALAKDEQAKEKFGDIDVKLPYLRYAKAPK